MRWEAPTPRMRPVKKPARAGDGQPLKPFSQMGSWLTVKRPFNPVDVNERGGHVTDSNLAALDKKTAVDEKADHGQVAGDLVGALEDTVGERLLALEVKDTLNTASEQRTLSRLGVGSRDRTVSRQSLFGELAHVSKSFLRVEGERANVSTILEGGNRDGREETHHNDTELGRDEVHGTYTHTRSQDRLEAFAEVLTQTLADD